jgi:UDP:flavonoid glycosyltransferase YjiC (YdhE family)
MALRNGCPILIIPHIVDQFIWNALIHDMGLGPKGINIGRITKKNLEPKILNLMNNSSFKIL